MEFERGHNAITNHCVIRNATMGTSYLQTCYFWYNFNEKVCKNLVGRRKLIFNAITEEIIKDALRVFANKGDSARTSYFF